MFVRGMWRSNLKDKIVLKSGEGLIRMRKSERKKIIGRGGINLDLSSLYLIGRYQRTSIIDAIDNRRPNEKYIDLLEKFKMDQRIR
jgi:hypothetical protein